MSAFDYPTWAALGRANADKLPSAVAEALGPERDELLPCPLCGGKASFLSIGGGYKVRCESCDTTGPWGDYGYQAQDKWNARCRPIGEVTVTDELVEALKALTELGCPVCGGDCAGANPPVIFCPMMMANNAIAKATQ